MYKVPFIPPDWVYERLNDLRYQDGELYWICNPPNGRKIGDVAGCIYDRKGYKRLDLQRNGSRCKLKVHHIVWWMFNGEWPPMQMDHRDRDPTNNKIENLRLAPGSLNNRNQARQKSRSGYKYIEKRRDDKFRVDLHVSRKERYELGTYKTVEEAVIVRDRALEFLGYIEYKDYYEPSKTSLLTRNRNKSISRVND